MNIFNPKGKKFFLAWFIAVALVIFQILPRKNEENLLFRLIYGTVGGIQTTSVNFHLATRDLINKYFFLLDLHETNSRLKKEQSQLQVENQVLKELEIENKRLKALLDFRKKQNRVFLAAQVVAQDFLSENELIVINKGSQHGVKKYMGVIHTKGVIGHIFRVSPYSSQVISLKNKLSVLPARVQQNRLKGLIEGQISDGLLFKYFNLKSLQTTSVIQKGDVIVTDSSKHFPPGIPIGEVLSTQKNKIKIKPYVDLEQVEDVFVLSNDITLEELDE